MPGTSLRVGGDVDQHMVKRDGTATPPRDMPDSIQRLSSGRADRVRRCAIDCAVQSEKYCVTLRAIVGPNTTPPSAIDSIARMISARRLAVRAGARGYLVKGAVERRPPRRFATVTPRIPSYAVDDVSQDVSSIADTHALPALVVLLVAAAVLTWALRRSGRAHQSFAALFASLASFCLIVAVTLLRDGLPEQLSLARLTDWSSGGFDRFRSDPFGSSQFILNIALFVPAGAAWAWMTKRPGVTAAALAAGSVLIESVQAVTGLGAPDVADLVANIVGACSGVAAAAIVGRVWAERGESTPSPRRRAIVAAAVLGVGSVALTVMFVGADQGQRSLRHELQAAFEGTTKADIDRWNAEGVMLEEVFGAVSVFADGTQYSPDEVKVRYPSPFFGLHRCVLVVWTPSSVRFDLESGDACIVFVG